MAKQTVYVQACLPKQHAAVLRRLPAGLRVKFVPAERPVPPGADLVVVWARFCSHRVTLAAKARARRVVIVLEGLNALVRTIREELANC